MFSDDILLRCWAWLAFTVVLVTSATICVGLGVLISRTFF